VLTGGCGGGGGDVAVDAVAGDGTGGPAGKLTYSGFSSEGGTWTFLLDPAEHALTFRKGNDAPMTRHFEIEDKAPIRFFLKAMDQGEESFGWEKPSRVLVHTFPLGTGFPSMFAAIGETAPGDSALVAGDYLWVEIGMEPEVGTALFSRWGILALRPEGTWSRWSFALPGSGGDDGGEAVLPDAYAGGWPLTSPPEAGGTWTQAVGTGQVTLSGGKTPQVGRVWTEEGTALLLLETAGGMVAGIRAPETPYANGDVLKVVPGETSGEQVVVGVWKTGARWVARCTLPGNQAKGFCYYRIPGVIDLMDEVVTQTRCGVLPNAFSLRFAYGANADPPGDWVAYVFAAGSLASVWMIVDPEDGVQGAAIGLRQDTADFDAYLCSGQLCE